MRYRVRAVFGGQSGAGMAALLLGSAMLPLGLSGCSIETVRQSEQEAVVYERAFLESQRLFESPGAVNICFLPRTDHGTVRLPDFYRIRTLINDTWGAATGLSFKFHVLCPDPAPSGYVTIYYRGDFAPTGNGQGQFGVGGRIGLSSGNEPERFENRSDVQLYLGTTNDWTAVHEFGHVLGFGHEWQDLKFQEDYSNCLDSIKKGQSDLEPDLTRMTESDGDSVMNYTTAECGAIGNNGYLSAMDAVVAGILYPKSTAPLGLKCTGAPCFNTADGVLGYGPGTYSSSWIAQGISASAVRQYSAFNGASILDNSAFALRPLNTSNGETLGSSTWSTTSVNYMRALSFKVQIVGATGGALGNREVAGSVEQSQATHTALTLVML